MRISDWSSDVCSSDLLRIRKLSRRRFAVDGTPTDSVLLAVTRVMKDHPPDIVLSGINRGGNMGGDVIYSGTVAAAMEAALLGIPAIALRPQIGRASCRGSVCKNV